MQNRSSLPESLPGCPGECWNQSDLWDQNDHGSSFTEDRFCRSKVDLGFPRASDTGQQEGAVGLRTERFEQAIYSELLISSKLERNRALVSGKHMVVER